MKLIDLERRLAQAEAPRSITAPAHILTDRAIGDPAGASVWIDALANWRQWVAQGRAAVRHGVLRLTQPEMTAEEWPAEHVIAYQVKGDARCS